MRLALYLLLVTNASGAEKPRLVLQTGHSSQVRQAWATPDGKRLLTAADDGLLEWDRRMGWLLGRRPLPGKWVTLSPDQHRAIVAEDRGLRVFDVETGSGPLLAGAGLPAAFLRDGRDVFAITHGPYALSRDTETPAAVWDSCSGSLLRRMQGDWGQVWQIAVTSDGTHAAAAPHGLSGIRERVWDISTGELIFDMANPGTTPAAVAINPDASTLAAASYEPTDEEAHLRPSLSIWDLRSGKEAFRWTGESPQMESIAFYDGGLITQGVFGPTAFWPLDGRSGPRTLSERQDDAALVALGGEPGRPVVAGRDGRLTILGPALSAPGEPFPREEMPLQPLELSASQDGLFLLVRHPDGFRVWDLERGRIAVTQTGDISVLGNRLAATGAGARCTTPSTTTIRILDLADGSVRRELSHWAAPTALALTPDDKRLVSGHADYTARVWDLASGESFSLGPQAGRIWSVKIDSASKTATLCSGDEESECRLWDLHSRRRLRTWRPELEDFTDTAGIALKGNRFNVAESSTGARTLLDGKTGQALLAFPPVEGRGVPYVMDRGDLLFRLDAGRRELAAWISKGQPVIRRWDLSAGRELPPLLGHEGKILDAQFAAGGRLLATASKDRTVRLWDLSQARELCRLVSYEDGGWAVLAPDGRFEASPEARGHLRWTVSGDSLPLDTFAKGYETPSLLAELLRRR